MHKGKRRGSAPEPGANFRTPARHAGRTAAPGDNYFAGAGLFFLAVPWPRQ